MYTYKDRKLTKEQVDKLAAEKGVEVDVFLTNNQDIQIQEVVVETTKQEGKTPTTETDTTVDVTKVSDTELPPVDGSLASLKLDLKEYDKRIKDLGDPKNIQTQASVDLFNGLIEKRNTTAQAVNKSQKQVEALKNFSLNAPNGSIPKYIETVGSQLDFVNALANPDVDTKELIENRWYMSNADSIKGAKALAKEKAQKEYLDNIESRWNRSMFNSDERSAYESWKKTGEIDKNLLKKPLKEVYVEAINPETLDTFTALEYLSNVKDNFFPQMEMGLESLKGMGADYLKMNAFMPSGIGIGKIPGIGYGDIEKLTEIQVDSNKKALELRSSLKQTGNMVDGIAQGDLASLVGGISNAISSGIATMGPAAVGQLVGIPAAATMSAIMLGPMVLEYNAARATNIYPDDPNAMEKYIRNQGMDYHVPVMLTAVSSGLEAIGFKEVSKAALANSGIVKNIMRSIKTAGKTEALTEYLQYPVDELNKAIGSGEVDILKDPLAAGKFILEKMFSKEGLEAALSGLVSGSTLSGIGGSIKTLAAMRAPSDIKGIESDLAEIEELQGQLDLTKDKTVSEGIKQKIKSVKSRLDSRIIKSNSILPKLNTKQIDEINNLDELSELQLKRFKELNLKLSKKEITKQEYNIAAEGFKSTYLDAKNKINSIVEEVKDKTTSETKLAEDIDVNVSADNLLKSSINEENTAIVLDPESTPAQIDKAKTTLVENNQGIINNVINKSFKRGLDTNLTREEFAADISLEVQKLINTYGKNKKTGKTAPFGIYLRDNLPLRVPAIFDKQLQAVDGDIFKKVDVSKADQETTEDAEIETTETELTPERVFLSEELVLPENVNSEINKVVTDLFSKGKIPEIGTKEFTKYVEGTYKNELKPIMAKFIGKNTDASLEIFLRENFKEIYAGIPQSVINKRFPAFKEAVLDKEGKQVREKTAQGNAVFKKKDITPAEFIKNFLGRDVGKSTQGTRKDALAETMAIIYANEASLGILEDAEVQKAFKKIQDLKPKDAIQSIDNLIKYVDSNYGRKSGKLFAGPLGVIAEAFIGGLKIFKEAIRLGKKFKDALSDFISHIKNELNSDAAADVVGSSIQTLEDLQNLTDKQFESIIEETQEAIDTEVELGKQNVAFFKDLKNLNIKNTLDLSRFNFKINQKAVDNIKSNRLIKATEKEQKDFIKKGKEIASAMPINGKKLFIDGKQSTLLQGLLGFHYRYVGSGKAPILYDNISTKSPSWVSKQTIDLFKDLPRTIISANNLKSIQQEINKASTLKEKTDIAKNNLEKVRKHQEDVDSVYYAIQSLLSDYVYSAKNESDLVNKIDFVTKIKSTNSNNINGDRALVKVNGFYVGPQGTKVKLEHVKTSSAQSIQGLEQILSGDIENSITDDFEGVYGFEFDNEGGSKFGFSKIDESGKTNTSQYYRFKDSNDAKNYILAEYNFEGTIAEKNILNLLKDKQQSSKSNNKILPENEKLKGEFSNKNVLNKMKNVDKQSLAEELKFSKSLDLDKDFNNIIENKTGIASDKTYARVKAEVAGANKGKFNFFIPPSAEDFVGLLYSTLGKGSTGDAQMAWYKAHLLNPFARAMENVSNDRVNIMQDFRALKKALNIVPKDLRKKISGEPFTREQAVRAYIWNKQGMDIPGISKKDQKDLVDFVDSNAELVVFADQLIAINKGDAYAAPDAGWIAGTIDTDFIKALNTTKRSKYLEVWQQNVDQIFSEANLNKLEAAYGKPYRIAMENILNRMKTGKNRNFGNDDVTGRFTDWLTNSVGAIMFFNTRSAVLQTISAVNFINFSDNNILKAGKAFANQPQYWKDFKKLFNSPFLLDRRSGIKLNVNEADIAEMANGPGNSARNVIAGILKAGFLPTQIADSFAIASGGASFYRNRIKALQKEGLTEVEAEEIAFRDFREIAEESQQSSRPDKISQQQAGPLGRIVLAFANTPAQYARLIKKAASDLKNGRGDAKTNISKIIYYGVAQNLLFSALQQALFAIAFDDEEEEEKKNEKYFNIINGMSDSVLRGVGVGGAIVSVVKNTALRLAKEADKKSPKYQDAVVKGVLQISPPISSKVGKLQSAGRSFSWNQEEMRTRGWSIDNPAYLASANVISAATNVPLDRAVKKITNIVDAGNEDIEYYKRVALALGWSAWELDIDKKDKKAPKTEEQKIFDLSKSEQIKKLLDLGLTKKEIKDLKYEEERVKAIINKQKEEVK